jgi:ankyrin repeat protein
MGYKISIVPPIAQDADESAYLALANAIYEGDYATFKKKISSVNLSQFKKQKFKLAATSGLMKKLTGASISIQPLQLAALNPDTQILVDLLNEQHDALLRAKETVEDVTSNSNSMDSVEIDGVIYAQGYTALHIAVAKGNLAAIRVLLDNDSDFANGIMHLQDKEGNTALHIAASLGRLEIIQFLIAKGAKRDAQNNLNQTPLTCLPTNASEELQQALRPPINIDADGLMNAMNIHNMNSQAQNSKLAGMQKMTVNHLEEATQALQEPFQSLSQAYKGNDPDEKLKIENQKKHVIQLQININELNKLITAAFTKIPTLNTLDGENEHTAENQEKLAAIARIKEQTEKMVQQTALLIASPSAGSADFIQSVNNYIQAMKQDMHALGDYKTAQKVLFWLVIAVLVIGLTASGVGIAAQIGGVGYATAAEAFIAGDALAKTGGFLATTSYVASAMGGIGGAIPLGLGCLWHRHKTQGMRAAENIGASAIALEKLSAKL